MGETVAVAGKLDAGTPPGMMKLKVKNAAVPRWRGIKGVEVIAIVYLAPTGQIEICGLQTRGVAPG